MSRQPWNDVLPGVQRTAVASSVIASVGFDAASNTLEIEFATGRIYRYFAVSRAVVEAMLASESVGAAFNRLVRDRYRFVEV